MFFICSHEQKITSKLAGTSFRKHHWFYYFTLNKNLRMIQILGIQQEIYEYLCKLGPHLHKNLNNQSKLFQKWDTAWIAANLNCTLAEIFLRHSGKKYTETPSNVTLPHLHKHLKTKKFSRNELHILNGTLAEFCLRHSGKKYPCNISNLGRICTL